RDPDTLHLHLTAGRSSFDVRNTIDMPDQAQHQKIDTFNVAPGYTRVIGSKTLLTATAFVRQDHVTYQPSPNLFNDSPATVSQDRRLTNFGGKVDVSYTSGVTNVQVG